MELSTYLRGDSNAAFSWDAWRVRAVDAFAAVLCIMALPAALALLGTSQPLPRAWSLAFATLYIPMLAALFVRRWGVVTRIWLLVIVACIIATMAMVNRGLVGHGRLALTVWPLWVLVLLGSRVGWASAAVSLGIYGVCMVLAVFGVLQAHQIATDDPTAPTTWLLQGIGQPLALVPVMVLLDRFRAYHMRTLRAEQQASAERQRLEAQIAQIGEEERRHLGREIHDGLCQQATAAVLMCTALEGQVAAQQGAAAARLGRLRELLEEMLESAYRISRGLCPLGPGPEGLVPALQLLAQRVREEFALACDFQQQGAWKGIGEQQSMHLYRIAQEAINNAVKHSKAQRLSIMLSSRDGELMLRVEDDGCGVSGQADRGAGMGMSIMDYRARCLGGALEISRSDRGGAAITCKVPLDSCRATSPP